MNATNTEQATHTAWRFCGDMKGALYVAKVTRGNGDRYEYTSKADDAMKLTEHQCRLFCSYMRECASVGYWS